MSTTVLAHLANAVLALHLAIVGFVVGGLGAIVVGNLRGWAWVNRWPFRLLHAGAIAIVVAEAWFGLTCPLTTLEMWLRARGGGATYAGGFIEHWLQALLYFDAPGWVFTLAYTGFGFAVAWSWYRFPPRRRQWP